MLRSVEPEWLDILPADDPSAQRSRRDLQRVNAWMRHPQILSRILTRVIRQSLRSRTTSPRSSDLRLWRDLLCRQCGQTMDERVRIENSQRIVVRHDCHELEEHVGRISL